MARKSKSPGPKPEPKIVEQGIFWLDQEAPWGGFVNIRLEDDQRADFLAWFEDREIEVNSYLDDVIGEGMKVGLAYDRENACYIVTFTGALMAARDARFCSTSRASSLVEAVALAVWKHIVLAAGDYGNYRPRTSTMMKWG